MGPQKKEWALRPIFQAGCQTAWCHDIQRQLRPLFCAAKTVVVEAGRHNLGTWKSWLPWKHVSCFWDMVSPCSLKGSLLLSALGERTWPVVVGQLLQGKVLGWVLELRDHWFGLPIEQTNCWKRRISRQLSPGPWHGSPRTYECSLSIEEWFLPWGWWDVVALWHWNGR